MENQVSVSVTSVILELARKNDVCFEFESSMYYIVSFMTANVAQGDPMSN